MSHLRELLSRLNLPVPEIDWLADTCPDVAALFRPSPDVREHADLPYRTDSAAGNRHRLDVYAPAAVAGGPVLAFAPGGSWVFGTKDWYAPFGRAMAKAGVCCVLMNYRLSPLVTHPAHAEDVAAAVRWVRDHIAEYAGDPGRLFVGGHSAGGHLAALAALDPTFGLAGAVRGVVGVSGVYDLDAKLPGFPLVFGREPGADRRASPITYATPGGPPVLAVYAANDYPNLDRQAEAIATATGGRALRVKGPDHVTLIVDAAAPAGQTHAAIRAFVR